MKATTANCWHALGAVQLCNSRLIAIGRSSEAEDGRQARTPSTKSKCYKEISVLTSGGQTQHVALALMRLG